MVTRMVGGSFTIAVRALEGVSPVRTDTVIGGTSSPSFSASSAISASGRSRFCWTSTARAFRGDTYTTLVRPRRSSPA